MYRTVRRVPRMRGCPATTPGSLVIRLSSSSSDTAPLRTAPPAAWVNPKRFDVDLDRLADVDDRLFTGLPLADAPRKARAFDYPETVLARIDHNLSQLAGHHRNSERRASSDTIPS